MKHNKFRYLSMESLLKGVNEKCSIFCDSSVKLFVLWYFLITWYYIWIIYFLHHLKKEGNENMICLIYIKEHKYGLVNTYCVKNVVLFPLIFLHYFSSPWHVHIRLQHANAFMTHLLCYTIFWFKLNQTHWFHANSNEAKFELFPVPFVCFNEATLDWNSFLFRFRYRPYNMQHKTHVAQQK